MSARAGKRLDFRQVRHDGACGEMMPETRLIDVNCTIFARANDYVDFIESADAVALLEGLTEVPAKLPAGFRATCQLTPPLYFSLADGIADDRRINDALLAAAARTNGLAAGVAEPKYGEAASGEIERIASLGAKSIVFSARAQGFFANDQLLADLCLHAFERGLVPMIHSAPFSVNESLERVWSLGRKCGSVPLVVVGATASWENVQAIADNRGGPDNLFYDLSGLSSTWDLASLLRTDCTPRLLFGSGGPRFAPGILAIVDELGPDPEDRRAILFENAAGLLGVEEGVRP